MENLEMIGKLFELVEGLSKPVEQHEVKIANLQSAITGLTAFVVSNASTGALELFLNEIGNNENAAVFTMAVKAELARRQPTAKLTEVKWNKFPDVLPPDNAGCLYVKIASLVNPNTYEAEPCSIVKLALWKNRKFTIDSFGEKEMDITSSVKEWSKLQTYCKDETENL